METAVGKMGQRKGQDNRHRERAELHTQRTPEHWASRSVAAHEQRLPDCASSVEDARRHHEG